MKRLNHLPYSVKQSLDKRSLLKVIAGLSNFDASSVELVARAAGRGGAQLIDVACDPDLVRLALKESEIPVCVSAVDPYLFPAALDAGAAMIEIGNFDSFYPQGRFFDAAEVIELTIHTRKLLPEAVLSVTVPHILPLDQQSQLALDLVKVGADIIQTEGGTSARPLSPGSLGLIEKASPTLAAVHVIAESFRNAKIDIPLICASGLSSVTIPMALASGATGVGVGSVVNKLNDELAMLAVVKRLNTSIHQFDTHPISS